MCFICIYTISFNASESISRLRYYTPRITAEEEEEGEEEKEGEKEKEGKEEEEGRKESRYRNELCRRDGGIDLISASLHRRGVGPELIECSVC